jgi:hypothetical protein
VARVLKTLGINHIRARSPQARGRSERAFRTLQDRLPKELRTEGVETYEGANRFLETTYIKAYNKSFAVKPAQKETAFTPMLGVNFGLLFSPNYFVSGHAAYIFLNSSTTFSKVSVFKKSGPSALVSGLA